MSDETIILFVDTNAFIHLRDLKDIPWKGLFPRVKALDIIVSSAVIEELDDFKVGRNKRKRDRARLALKQIVQASAQGSNGLLLREHPILVKLKVAPHKLTNWEGFPSLDKTKNDHRLIADAIDFGDKTILFSFDTGPIITARMLGLKAEQPKEDWFLPDEPTETELKLKLVQKQLLLARVNNPIIEAGFGSVSESVKKIDLVIPILPALDADLAQRLVGTYLNLYPQQTIKVEQSSYLMVGAIYSNKFTQADKDEYTADYAKFETEVIKYFHDLHTLVYKISRAQPVPYFILNNSHITAENLKVEFQISKNFIFLSDREDADDNVGKASLPQAPDRPKTGADRMFSGHVHGLLGAKKDKDPTGFYWQKNPKYGSQNCSEICQEFRATEIYENESWICLWDDKNTRGELDIKITASNLGQPICIVSEFELKEYETDWLDERVLRRLPKELSEILRKEIQSS